MCNGTLLLRGGSAVPAASPTRAEQRCLPPSELTLAALWGARLSHVPTSHVSQSSPRQSFGGKNGPQSPGPGPGPLWLRGLKPGHPDRARAAVGWGEPGRSQGLLDRPREEEGEGGHPIPTGFVLLCPPCSSLPPLSCLPLGPRCQVCRMELDWFRLWGRVQTVGRPLPFQTHTLWMPLAVGHME